jgi:hypothetical protein
MNGSLWNSDLAGEQVLQQGALHLLQVLSNLLAKILRVNVALPYCPFNASISGLLFRRIRAG